MSSNSFRNRVIRSSDLPFTRGEFIELQARIDAPDAREQWEQRLAAPTVPKVLDLFCGAGGLSTGFVDAGFCIAAGIDHDADAVATFAANIAARTIVTDIGEIENPETIFADLDLSDLDVIVGGPPCQGFSMAGRSRIRSLDDEDQVRLFTRNELYEDFFRFVEAFRPPFFLFENVQGLLSFADGAYIRAIEEECERLGYVPEIEVIDAVDYGVPQFRRRLFVVGSRVGRLYRWPRILAEQDRVPLEAAIGDLPHVMPPSLKECLPYNTPEDPSLYQQLMRVAVPAEDRDVVYDHIVRPVRDDDRFIFINMKPGDRYTDIDPRYRRYDDSKFKDKYYMLRPDEPGNTITAHLAKDGYRYIHWDTEQHRTLSVREAARIQGFGDHYRFAGSRTSRFRQIGNAVPPILAEKLATQLRRAMRRANGHLHDGEALQHALPLPGWERHRQLIDHSG